MPEQRFNKDTRPPLTFFPEASLESGAGSLSLGHSETNNYSYQRGWEFETARGPDVGVLIDWKTGVDWCKLDDGFTKCVDVSNSISIIDSNRNLSSSRNDYGMGSLNSTDSAVVVAMAPGMPITEETISSNAGTPPTNRTTCSCTSEQDFLDVMTFLNGEDFKMEDFYYDDDHEAGKIDHDYYDYSNDKASNRTVRAAGTLTKEMTVERKQPKPNPVPLMHGTAAAVGVIANINIKNNLVFPSKLHLILDDADTKGFSNVISWVHLPDRSGFKVHNKTLFNTEIMPQYFKSTKYKSFQRQLDYWGFQRMGYWPFEGVYLHTYFIHGKPEFCKLIQRAKPRRRNKAKSTKKDFITNNRDDSQSQSRYRNQSSTTRYQAPNAVATMPPSPPPLRPQQQELQDLEVDIFAGMDTLQNVHLSTTKNQNAGIEAPQIGGVAAAQAQLQQPLQLEETLLQAATRQAKEQPTALLQACTAASMKSFEQVHDVALELGKTGMESCEQRRCLLVEYGFADSACPQVQQQRQQWQEQQQCNDQCIGNEQNSALGALLTENLEAIRRRREQLLIGD